MRPRRLLHLFCIQLLMIGIYATQMRRLWSILRLIAAKRGIFEKVFSSL